MGKLAEETQIKLADWKGTLGGAAIGAGAGLAGHALGDAVAKGTGLRDKADAKLRAQGIDPDKNRRNRALGTALSGAVVGGTLGSGTDKATRDQAKKEYKEIGAGLKEHGKNLLEKGKGLLSKGEGKDAIKASVKAKLAKALRK